MSKCVIPFTGDLGTGMSLSVNFPAAGRKRKVRRRKPCGRLAPDVRPDDRKRVAQQPHRRGVKDGKGVDERAESPLGRLWLAEKIDEDQYNAGARFAAVVAEYRAVIGAPRADPGAGSPRRSNCALIDTACGADDCGCRRRQERYEVTYEVLARAGRPAMMAVKAVVIERREDGQDLAALRAGLAALAMEFGFTTRRGAG